ncbi:hypothetical protein CI109_104646 [Kwoniella shandongensis]|uniref:Uncharacterized protein n=1 Tax=Kwoniella shandongensis TaxID=1734106 RepID=A0A5M6BY53_9TREE|nr:uncharacterized protein CI109_004812 [Kwoniella shandongensis]KAA5526812.1 hypothetical protein CI109_004812 [Kwoniella shandongensis]
MALASSSSSVLRSTRCLSTPLLAARPTKSSKRIASSARGYAAAATASVETPLSAYEPITTDSSSTTSPRTTRTNNFTPRSSSNSPTTASSAQEYLTNLLSLPSHRQFPPALALQILTHKSYRYSHPIRHLSPSDESNGVGSEPYNSRLSFIGRRALSTYLSIFVHDAFLSSAAGGGLKVDGTDFLRGKGLQERLDGLRHVNNLGRVLGDEWGVGQVTRWDRNETSREGGDLKIKGMSIEAILGGIYTQFGSPAAHRTFHKMILPGFARSNQLRDPRLVEKVETVKEQLEKEFGTGILARS